MTAMDVYSNVEIIIIPWYVIDTPFIFFYCCFNMDNLILKHLEDKYLCDMFLYYFTKAHR